MEKTINVFKLLGSDIRSRSNAGAIVDAINSNGKTNCVIDMAGVTFVSRSFADELLAICKKTLSIIVNAHGVVSTMIDIVGKSRKEETYRAEGNERIVNLKDMVSLDNYFASF